MSIAAAAGLATNFREPQGARAVTRYYGNRAREIRADAGHGVGDPALRPAGSSLPSQVTTKYAREAAEIRRRSGLS